MTLSRDYTLRVERPFICKACGEEITDDVVVVIEPAETMPSKQGDEVARMALFHENHAPTIVEVP